MATSLTHPPGPKSLWPFAILRKFRKDAPAYLLKTRREHGEIAFLRLASQDVYLINDPEYVKEVLVTQQGNFTKSRVLQRAKRMLGEGLLTSEGEFHLRQRRLMQPAFHRDRLRGYANAMTDWGLRTRDRWQRGQTVDMAEEMMRLTLAVVAQTLFSANVEEEAADIGEALTSVLDLFNLVMLPFSEILEKLPLPFMKRFIHARTTLDRIIYRIIAEHRASGEDKGDLLSMLLLAQDEDDRSAAGRMNDEQVRDEAMTLFLAGHETTANALTWTWYLLSEHPEIAAKMHAEIDRVLGGRTPGFDDMPALKYVEMVFAESMRLYPPAWAIGRKAIHPFTLGGYEIAADSIVLMSPFVMHRDPRFYPDPQRFDPERWLPEAVAARPKFAYFPFGGGARLCIGERFAWMEGVLLLTCLAQKFAPKLVPGHPVETKAMITLRPKHGMKMILEPR